VLLKSKDGDGSYDIYLGEREARYEFFNKWKKWTHKIQSGWIYFFFSLPSAGVLGGLQEGIYPVRAFSIMSLSLSKVNLRMDGGKITSFFSLPTEPQCAWLNGRMDRWMSCMYDT
jgi:hypothetical protein